ncbi:MAG: TetR/AcrR family transcriptional regulator [Bacillota bacterium]
MIEKFKNLEHEKREKIINAAMAEFALRGYEKASTNEIVKKAGISKGLLFHYFGNKKQLFLFLFDYGAEIIAGEIHSKLDRKERRLFAIIKQITKIKMELMRKYEKLFEFLQAAYMDRSPEIRGEIERRGAEAPGSVMAGLFKNTDVSGFRRGLDLGKALDIITWTTEGIVRGELNKYRLMNIKPDYNAIFFRCEEFMKLLEALFYEGGQEK